MTDKLQRPEDFEFALDFLGDPEASELRAYIQQLEARAARAALAQPEPEAVGPTDEELFRIASDCAALYIADDRDYDNCSEVMAAMRAVLARYGHQPTPVPVAERLPGPEDCLDEGWAWFFSPRVGWRQAVLPVSPAFTHWLPARALPLPQGEVE